MHNPAFHKVNTKRRDFLSRTGAAISALLAPGAAAHAATASPGGDAAQNRQLYRSFAAADRSTNPDGTGLVRVLHNPSHPAETIAIAPGRQSATAQFHCLAQVAKPLTGAGSPIAMARLQGQFAETWWESGVHELECVRTAAGWTLRGVRYRTLARHPGPGAGLP